MDSWFSESGDDCEQELKKFAESIVRECARLADEETSLPYDSYGEKIKQNFGVKE
jgi:hypothetical protein